MQTGKNFIFPPLCVKFFLNSFFLPEDPIECSGHFQILKSQCSLLPNSKLLTTTFVLPCQGLLRAGKPAKIASPLCLPPSGLLILPVLHVATGSFREKGGGQDGSPNLTGADVTWHKHPWC